MQAKKQSSSSRIAAHQSASQAHPSDAARPPASAPTKARPRPSSYKGPVFSIDKGFREPDYKEQMALQHVMFKMRDKGIRTAKLTDYWDHWDLMPPPNPRTEPEVKVYETHVLVRAGFFNAHKLGYCVKDLKWIISDLLEVLMKKFEVLEPATRTQGNSFKQEIKERATELFAYGNKRGDMRMADIGTLVVLLDVLLEALKYVAMKEEDFDWIEDADKKQELAVKLWNRLNVLFGEVRCYGTWFKGQPREPFPWLPRVVIRCEEVLKIKNTLYKLREAENGANRTKDVKVHEALREKAKFFVDDDDTALTPGEESRDPRADAPGLEAREPAELGGEAREPGESGESADGANGGKEASCDGKDEAIAKADAPTAGATTAPTAAAATVGSKARPREELKVQRQTPSKKEPPLKRQRMQENQETPLQPKAGPPDPEQPAESSLSSSEDGRSAGGFEGGDKEGEDDQQDDKKDEGDSPEAPERQQDNEETKKPAQENSQTQQKELKPNQSAQDNEEQAATYESVSNAGQGVSGTGGFSYEQIMGQSQLSPTNSQMHNQSSLSGNVNTQKLVTDKEKEETIKEVNQDLENSSSQLLDESIEDEQSLQNQSNGQVNNDEEVLNEDRVDFLQQNSNQDDVQIEIQDSQEDQEEQEAQQEESLQQNDRQEEQADGEQVEEEQEESQQDESHQSGQSAFDREQENITNENLERDMKDAPYKTRAHDAVSDPEHSLPSTTALNREKPEWFPADLYPTVLDVVREQQILVDWLRGYPSAVSWVCVRTKLELRILGFLCHGHHLPPNVVGDLLQGMSTVERVLLCMTLPVWQQGSNGFRLARTEAQELQMRTKQLSYIRCFHRVVRKLRTIVLEERAVGDNSKGTIKACVRSLLRMLRNERVWFFDERNCAQDPTGWIVRQDDIFRLEYTDKLTQKVQDGMELLLRTLSQERFMACVLDEENQEAKESEYHLFLQRDRAFDRFTHHQYRNNRPVAVAGYQGFSNDAELPEFPTDPWFCDGLPHLRRVNFHPDASCVFETSQEQVMSMTSAQLVQYEKNNEELEKQEQEREKQEEEDRQKAQRDHLPTSNDAMMNQENLMRPPNAPGGSIDSSSALTANANAQSNQERLLIQRDQFQYAWRPQVRGQITLNNGSSLILPEQENQENVLQEDAEDPEVRRLREEQKAEEERLNRCYTLGVLEWKWPVAYVNAVALMPLSFLKATDYHSQQMHMLLMGDSYTTQIRGRDARKAFEAWMRMLCDAIKLRTDVTTQTDQAMAERRTIEPQIYTWAAWNAKQAEKEEQEDALKEKEALKSGAGAPPTASQNQLALAGGSGEAATHGSEEGAPPRGAPRNYVILYLEDEVREDIADKLQHSMQKLMDFIGPVQMLDFDSYWQFVDFNVFEDLFDTLMYQLVQNMSLRDQQKAQMSKDRWKVERELDKDYNEPVETPEKPEQKPSQQQSEKSDSDQEMKDLDKQARAGLDAQKERQQLLGKLVDKKQEENKEEDKEEEDIQNDFNQQIQDFGSLLLSNLTQQDLERQNRHQRLIEPQDRIQDRQGSNEGRNNHKMRSDGSLARKNEMQDTQEKEEVILSGSESSNEVIRSQSQRARERLYRAARGSSAERRKQEALQKKKDGSLGVMEYLEDAYDQVRESSQQREKKEADERRKREEQKLLLLEKKREEQREQKRQEQELNDELMQDVLNNSRLEHEAQKDLDEKELHRGIQQSVDLARQHLVEDIDLNVQLGKDLKKKEREASRKKKNRQNNLKKNEKRKDDENPDKGSGPGKPPGSSGNDAKFQNKPIESFNLAGQKRDSSQRSGQGHKKQQKPQEPKISSSSKPQDPSMNTGQLLDKRTLSGYNSEDDYLDYMQQNEKEQRDADRAKAQKEKGKDPNKSSPSRRRSPSKKDPAQRTLLLQRNQGSGSKRQRKLDKKDRESLKKARSLSKRSFDEEPLTKTQQEAVMEEARRLRAAKKAGQREAAKIRKQQKEEREREEALATKEKEERAKINPNGILDMDPPELVKSAKEMQRKQKELQRRVDQENLVAMRSCQKEQDKMVELNAYWLPPRPLAPGLEQLPTLIVQHDRLSRECQDRFYRVLHRYSSEQLGQGWHNWIQDHLKARSIEHVESCKLAQQLDTKPPPHPQLGLTEEEYQRADEEVTQLIQRIHARGIEAAYGMQHPNQEPVQTSQQQLNKFREGEEPAFGQMMSPAQQQHANQLKDQLLQISEAQNNQSNQQVPESDSREGPGSAFGQQESQEVQNQLEAQSKTKKVKEELAKELAKKAADDKRATERTETQQNTVQEEQEVNQEVKEQSNNAPTSTNQDSSNLDVINKLDRSTYGGPRETGGRITSSPLLNLLNEQMESIEKLKAKKEEYWRQHGPKGHYCQPPPGSEEDYSAATLKHFEQPLGAPCPCGETNPCVPRPWDPARPVDVKSYSEYCPYNQSQKSNQEKVLVPAKQKKDDGIAEETKNGETSEQLKTTEQKHSVIPGETGDRPEQTPGDPGKVPVPQGPVHLFQGGPMVPQNRVIDFNTMQRLQGNWPPPLQNPQDGQKDNHVMHYGAHNFRPESPPITNFAPGQGQIQTVQQPPPRGPPTSIRGGVRSGGSLQNSLNQQAMKMQGQTNRNKNISQLQRRPPTNNQSLQQQLQQRAGIPETPVIKQGGRQAQRNVQAQAPASTDKKESSTSLTRKKKKNTDQQDLSSFKFSNKKDQGGGPGGKRGQGGANAGRATNK